MYIVVPQNYSSLPNGGSVLKISSAAEFWKTSNIYVTIKFIHVKLDQIDIKIYRYSAKTR